MTTTDTPIPRRKRVRHPERPMLTPESCSRIDRWTEQLASRLNGRRLARAAFINWLVMGHAEDLNDSELAALHSLHFDPVRALRWATRMAIEKKEKGELVDVHAIVDEAAVKKPRQSPRSGKKPRQSIEPDSADATPFPSDSLDIKDEPNE